VTSLNHVRTEQGRLFAIQEENSHQDPTMLVLISDFQFPQLWENKFLSFKPLSQWYIIMVAQMYKDKYHLWSVWNLVNT
jgi:hypothetical protein